MEGAKSSLVGSQSGNRWSRKARQETDSQARHGQTGVCTLRDRWVMPPNGRVEALCPGFLLPVQHEQTQCVCGGVAL